MRDLLAPDFIAGKAQFLRDLTHSWEGALVKADWYASFEPKKPIEQKAQRMWRAVAAHIRATHPEGSHA